MKTNSVIEFTPHKIASLNDLFRNTFLGGKVRLSPNVQSLDDALKQLLISAVREFKQFNEDNDPHGEHDFGVVPIMGKKFYWKIDYFDTRYEFLSEDPSNPKVTNRVLTILEACEW